MACGEKTGRRDFVRILYQCEICGAESQDQEEIRSCEAQGNKAKFPIGAGITFRLPPYRRPILAQIMGIEIRERTHSVYYDVVSHDEILPQESRGVIKTISEEGHYVKGIS